MSASLTDRRGASSTFAALVEAMRPRQWTKSLVVFAPLIFSGRVNDPDSVLAVVPLFVALCLASSASYLFNDVRDREADGVHPLKRARPVASGRLGPVLAFSAAAMLAIGALLLALSASAAVAAWLVAFLALQGAYTLVLRRLAVVDVAGIAASFLLRVQIGAVTLGLSASPMMLASAGLLAVFLALGKRRHELLLLDESTAHRTSLTGLDAASLDRALLILAVATVVAYGAWSFEPGYRQAAAFLPLSTIPVAAGLARYLYLVHRRSAGGSPEDVLITDIPLLVILLSWGALLALALYVIPGR